MLFVFNNAEEIEKILDNEPWSFDRYLVSLQRLETAIPVHELALNTVSLWVQVHNIRVSYLNRGVAEDLCEVVGEVDQSSRDVDVDGGSFIRVQVRVDISVPLCRARCFRLRMRKSIGCHSNTNVSPTFATGVDA